MGRPMAVALRRPRRWTGLLLALSGMLILGVALFKFLTTYPSLTALLQRILVDGLGLPPYVVDPALMFVSGVILLLFVVLPAVMWPMIYGLRKILAFFQARLGPMRVGRYGWLQTVADALKLLTKEDTHPEGADRWVFTLAPMLVFLPSFLVYVVIPFGPGNSWVARDLNAGILYISAITSIAVLGILSAGWASQSKWSLLGALRAAAQLVSYEVPMVLALMGPVVLAGTLRLQGIVEAQGSAFWEWFLWPQFLGFLVFLIASMAETSHTPFDLPEAESELVAGYHIEYSGLRFAFFFLAEFANVFTAAALASVLFLGGWRAPLPFLPEGGVFGVFWFLGKTLLMVFFYMWVRATLPRVRIDQLMEFAWKGMIPLALLNLMLAGLLVVARGG